MSYMSKDWSVTVNKQDRKTMLGVANITRKLSIRSTVLVIIVVLSYVGFRFREIQRTGRRLIFQANFPYNTTSSPSYELTLFGQLVGTMYAAVTYTAVDTFIATLVLHICGQLSNLHRELISLSAYTKVEFQTKLKNIVRKHEYLNRFAEIIEDSFNKMLLLQMLGCTMQLCFQALQAFMTIHFADKMDEMLMFKISFLFLYVSYILLQLYLYCYIGEKLLVKSTQIAYAAYDCSWYNLSARDARSLVTIMCRARTPLQITAGRFCSFNQELFSEVLKKSMAYMSCIYAMNSFD
ncbi:odorant receptor 13a [Monomorium pharaonis]|uniref:odorant receptor 13a n=1 Tax=Monomorium pharaonis TaxID=307658 RepID=UPI00102E12DB|nr:odorant receptor 13a [Monomorium pharaonis]